MLDATAVITTFKQKLFMAGTVAGGIEVAQCVARTLKETVEWEEEQEKPKPEVCKPKKPVIVVVENKTESTPHEVTKQSRTHFA